MPVIIFQRSVMKNFLVLKTKKKTKTKKPMILVKSSYIIGLLI